MSKINILDSSIYNRISAGEVVERPASVVKELIENSLDAKANSIIIEIQTGGIKLIRVTDNGVGLDYSDLKNAFLPHSTSKIANVEDLDSISTLGFRGEALASISSVSKVEMFSKSIDSYVGGRIIVNGGTFEDVTEYGCADGTSIIVRDLFFNTPARLKFLKSVKQEENAITNIVNRLILANPEISFKYIIDDKIIYNSIQKGLKNKIYDIYGKECVNNLIEINAKKSFYKINGFISLPNYCKPNRTYQTLVVNGRYVNNSLISVAVTNAYENFLMKGKFPFFVLNVNLDFRDIDVNVHPSKMEVKFKDTKFIFSFVYEIILQALNENNCPVSFQINNSKDFSLIEKNKQDLDEQSLKKVTGGFSFNDFKNLSEEINKINVSAPIYKNNNNILRSDYTSKCAEYFKNNSRVNDKNSIVDKNEKDLNKINNFNNIDKLSSYFGNENLKLDNICEINKKENSIVDFAKTDVYKKEYVSQEKFNDSFNYKLIGTIFNTYIIIENENSIYLLDQHAGHERVLFDKLIALFEEKKLISQPLLLPYIFTVNELEENLVLSNFDSFKNFGFEIEPFGNYTYKVSSVPNILDDINLQEFIDDILSSNLKVSANNEQIKNKFATMACKAAVKGGQKLNEDEIEILLKKVFSNNTTLLCPHGRPVCVKLTKYDIEKIFKRIV